MEIEIIKKLQSIGGAELDLACKIVSYLASYLGFIFWIVIFFVFYKKKFAVNFGITYGVSVGINYLIKTIVARPRPYVVDSAIINKLSAIGYAFPSGHTLSASVICSFLLFWIIKKCDNKVLKVFLCGFVVVFLLAVIFSRMYLGQHYLSDTIGGLLLGVCFSLIGILTYLRTEQKMPIDKKWQL